MPNSWETAFLRRVTGFCSSLQWTTKNTVCLCEKGRYTMNLRLNYSHIPPTMNSSKGDQTLLQAAWLKNSSVHFEAISKISLPTVCDDGNCLGQGLHTNCKESAGKNFQCGKGRFGNRPFQAL